MLEALNNHIIVLIQRKEPVHVFPFDATQSSMRTENNHRSR